MDRISRGWALTKQSWRVLKSDRSLVVFPILSTIFALSVAVAIISSALTEIFRVAVYQYAVAGTNVGAFDDGLQKNAFDGRTRRG
jgi:hypothetical protein